jgi:uncharacterized membrane protein YeaQ/YmgE (transglycosylase-associated protein family)
MGLYVWCVIGVVLGWLAIMASGETQFILRIESVLVGIFGSYFGGEFLATTLLHPADKGAGLSGAAVGMALGGSVVSLVLLRVMRKAVGPLKQSKKRGRES